MSQRNVILMAAGLTVTLAGCGMSQSATPATSSSQTMTKTSPAPSKTVQVAELQTNKTAQMVKAGQQATFVVTATGSGGQPAVGEPVTVYIGPMVALGAGVSQWYTTGAANTSRYVSSYSKKTNSMGQATIVLVGQPAKTMEMVGIKVGSFSTFSSSAMKRAGLMDAWWTTPSTSPTAPVGDYVVVKPFAKDVPAGTAQPLLISVMSPSGPVSGASVSVTPKTGGSSSMGSSSSMSSTGGTTMITNSHGQVSYQAKAGAAMSALPIRIVVSKGMGRIAGGMNADVVSK